MYKSEPGVFGTQPWRFATNVLCFGYVLRLPTIRICVDRDIPLHSRPGSFPSHSLSSRKPSTKHRTDPSTNNLPRSQVIIRTWSFRRSTTKFSLPWYRHTRDSTFRATHASDLSGSSTQTGTSSTLTMKDYYERKLGGSGNGNGVTIIGRPEEAFARSPRRTRASISTWGF